MSADEKIVRSVNNVTDFNYNVKFNFDCHSNIHLLSPVVTYKYKAYSTGQQIN